MKKEWYIFQGTHHKGPFSKNDLLEFYQDGSLKSETLVWREDASEWEPLHKVAELRFILNSEIPPAKLVDLPNDSDAESDELDELPPPLPPLPTDEQEEVPRMKRRVLAKIPEKFKDPTRLDLPPVPELMELLGQEKKPFFNWQRYKWVLAFLFVVIFSFGAYLLMKSFSSVPQSLYIRGLNPQNLERLETIMHRPLHDKSGKENLEMDFALTVDGKEIWLTTNLPDEAILQVTLSSKEKRVLGIDSVIVESRARLKDHQARFSKIRLLKGNNFTPGEYSFKVKGKRLHWLNVYFTKLQSLSFFKNLNKDFVYEGQTIIYSGAKNDFEYRLIEYRKEIVGNLIRPYEEKIETINTLKTLVQKSYDSLQVILRKSKPQQEMGEFEKFFIKEISPMLQGIVAMSSEKNHNDIVEASKSFGESITDLIQFVSKKKKWVKTDRDDAEKAMKRLKSQIFYLDTQIRKVEADIKKIRENP